MMTSDQRIAMLVSAVFLVGVTLSARAGARERVPVNVTAQSGGIDLGAPHVRLLLELPFFDEERKLIINNLIDYPIDGTSEQRRMLVERRDQVVAAISTLFMQNRVGRFEVRVRSRNNEDGCWIGPVESSVTIEVPNDGTFFDRVRAMDAARQRRQTAK